MKVLFTGRYNESEILSGPEKVSKRIFHEYIKSNPSVFAEYFFDGREYSFIKKIYGSYVIAKFGESKVLRLGLVKLFRLLFTHKPSTIHIISYERFSLICFLYKFFAKVNIVYTVHGIISYENEKLKNSGSFHYYKDRFCEYVFLNYSDKLIFLSDTSLLNAGKYYKIDNSRIKIIPNGIDEVFFHTGIIKKNNYSENLKIVFIGEIERKEKGFDFMIDALNKTGINIELFVLGLNNSFDINNFNNISLTFANKKNTEEFAQFLLDKDIYISSSYYEQFSISAVECMSAGLVPLVTKETGMSSFIDNVTNGFTFNYNDYKELADKILLLNSDREKLNLLSSGAKKIFNSLSWKNIFDQYKDVYK